MLLPDPDPSGGYHRPARLCALSSGKSPLQKTMEWLSFSYNSDPQLGCYSPQGTLGSVWRHFWGQRCWWVESRAAAKQGTMYTPQPHHNHLAPHGNSTEVGQSSPRIKPAGCPSPWPTVNCPHLCSCPSGFASYIQKHRFVCSFLELLPALSCPTPLPCCLLCLSCPLLSLPHTCSLHYLCLLHPLRFMPCCHPARSGPWHSGSPEYVLASRPALCSHIPCANIHFCFLCTYAPTKLRDSLWWGYAFYKPSVSHARHIVGI